MPRSILDIYGVYHIFAHLQLHQLRVAAVAKLICDHLTPPIDNHAVVEACLLHDMGNILKVDLDEPLFPEDFSQEGIACWKVTQEEIRCKYGQNVHIATVNIAKEIGVASTTMYIIDAIGFSHTIETLQKPLDAQIGCYSDMRVAPDGVESMLNRIDEAKRRYTKKKSFNDPEFFEKTVRAFQQIEENIFKGCALKPGDLNKLSLMETIEELKTWQL